MALIGGSAQPLTLFVKGARGSSQLSTHSTSSYLNSVTNFITSPSRSLRQRRLRGSCSVAFRTHSRTFTSFEWLGRTFPMNFSLDFVSPTTRPAAPLAARPPSLSPDARARTPPAAASQSFAPLTSALRGARLSVRATAGASFSSAWGPGRTALPCASRRARQKPNLRSGATVGSTSGAVKA